MTTTDRDLDRTADGVLTFDFGEVDALVLRWCLEKATLLGRQWLNNVLVVEEAHCLVETADRVVITRVKAVRKPERCVPPSILWIEFA